MERYREALKDNPKASEPSRFSLENAERRHDSAADELDARIRAVNTTPTTVTEQKSIREHFESGQQHAFGFAQVEIVFPDGRTERFRAESDARADFLVPHNDNNRDLVARPKYLSRQATLDNALAKARIQARARIDTESRAHARALLAREEKEATSDAIRLEARVRAYLLDQRDAELTLLAKDLRSAVEPAAAR